MMNEKELRKQLEGKVVDQKITWINNEQVIIETEKTRPMIDNRTGNIVEGAEQKTISKEIWSREDINSHLTANIKQINDFNKQIENTEKKASELKIKDLAARLKQLLNDLESIEKYKTKQKFLNDVNNLEYEREKAIRARDLCLKALEVHPSKL